jgi:hypothetical protein
MALKTVAVEVTEWEAVALISDAQRNLGRLYAEYGEREKFLIDEAEADVAKWQAVLDTFDKPTQNKPAHVLWRNIK